MRDPTSHTQTSPPSPLHWESTSGTEESWAPVCQWWNGTCGNKISQSPDVADSCQTAVWEGKGYKECSRKGGPGAPIMNHISLPSKCLLRGMTCIEEGWEGKGLVKDSW